MFKGNIEYIWYLNICMGTAVYYKVKVVGSSGFNNTIGQMSVQLDKLYIALQAQSTETKELTSQIKGLCIANGMLEDCIIPAETNSSATVDKVIELEQSITILKKVNSSLSQQLLIAENYSKKCQHK